MPKGSGGFLTAKAIANRIKAKGLQKLRWYCQICEKQCRDENGYRCHIQSPSHQQQMKLFGENPKAFIEDFSAEFQNTFVNLLSQRYGTTRVFANKVYQEVVSDRNHVHMNATKWSTLSEFVKHLGREGIVHVDETERGFYISWIDNSPHTLAKREAVMKMERQNKDQEERDRLLIEEQIERGGSAVSLTAPIAVATEIKRDPTTEKISINLTKRPIGTASRRYLNLPLASSSNQTSSLLKLEENNVGLENSTFIPPPVKSEKRTFAVLDEILQSEEKNKKKKPIADNSTNADSKEKVESSDFPWIKPGIIVKVLNSSLAGGKYMNRKGKIIRCIGDYVAEIQLLDSSDVIRLDQVHLQTSVPPVGDLVLVLKGDDRGAMALVEKLHIDRFCADLLLLREDGSESQRHLIGIDYDWFSRFYA